MSIQTQPKSPRKIPYSLPLLFATSLCLLFSGCLKERYTYPNIKAESKIKPPLPDLQPQRPAEAIQELLSRPITLGDAIKIALQNNPDVDMAIARIRQSDAMIDEATAAFFPVLSFYGEYMQGDAPSAYLFKTIDQRKLPPDLNFNYPGWFENYEIGLRGRINIFNGGRDLLGKKMAETGLKIHELDRQSVENALVTSVIHAFYNTLAALDYIKIARKSVNSVKTQLRIMQVRYKAGGALRSDVLSLKVRLAQAQEDLIRARNNHSLSIASLANLLGVDPDTPLTMAETEEVPLDLPKGYKAGLIYALANRPELKRVRQQIIRSRMALDVARSEFLPRLDAQARYYLDDPGLRFDKDRDNWTAGIILNWDFFTGFSTRARVKKSQGVLAEMLAADRKTTQSIQLDLKTSFLKLNEARARLAVAQASVAQAEESLRLVKTQYDGGSVTITRYLDAELARNRARTRATAAHNDREKALAAVGRALGYWGKYAQEERTKQVP
jgi:outer membrane protein TolC